MQFSDRGRSSHQLHAAAQVHQLDFVAHQQKAPATRILPGPYRMAITHSHRCRVATAASAGGRT